MKNIRYTIIKKTVFTALILLVTLTFNSSKTYAQQFSGKADYVIKLAEDVFYFNATLEFNNHESIFVSKKRNKSKWFRESETGFEFQTIYTDKIGHTVYRNNKDNQVLIRSFYEESNPVIYQDNFKIKWNITSEEKTIQGTKCQKAIANFRGRDYQAWFAPSLPVSFGPWKFADLPGLIFQISDTKGEVSMQIKSLQIDEIKKEIEPSTKGTKITMEEYYEGLNIAWEKYYKKNKASLAQLRAEFPELEISDNNLSKTRVATEHTLED